MISKKLSAPLMGAALIASSCLAAMVSTSPAMAACPTQKYVKVTNVGGPTHESIGTRVGKRNGSSVTSTLSIALTATKEKSTAWSVGGGASVGWGIATIEAKTNYEVSEKVARGQTWTNTIQVPAGQYGYSEPKVTFQKFSIDEWQEAPNCSQRHLRTIGVIRGILGVTFSECVGREVCTPRP
ncbi:hypothetical protein QLQ12_46410 [Actinoplanes sp. NEAU-A12]|uniref:Secreted protein n=1 Tax=Actinoplanes sandaracinus TaxID=3045177 RepID=A0ABT6X279_9ACTN|nr:hypothetical protein [Actinoplanes sandaracinus]MDI6106024.1 hypothetical protein [Actinoplanes sandaracinus]